MSEPQTWIDELLEAWRTNNRINLLLIDHISDEGMKCTLSKRGGRNVVRQFCHLHNVRVWHLEARAKELSKGLYKFETEEEPDKERQPAYDDWLSPAALAELTAAVRARVEGGST